MPAIENPIGLEVGLAYVITGPDGTRAVLNDTTDPDFVGFTNGEDGVTGLERAGVRENADTLPEADGGVHGTFRSDRLSFTLKGIIPPDSPAAANDGWVGRQARLLAATDAMEEDAYLSWRPTGYLLPVRTDVANLATNPSFELPGTTGWTLTNSSGNTAPLFQRENAWSKAGDWSLRVSSTNPNDSVNRRTGVQTLAGNLGFPVVGGTAVGIRVSLRIIDPAVTHNFLALWYQADGSPSATISTSSALVPGLGAGAETDLVGAMLVPADAAFLTVRVQGLSNIPLDTVDFWLDALMVAPIASIASPVPDYVDGNMDGYTWDDTPDGSVTYNYPLRPGAVRVNFRQQQPTRITGRRPKAFLVAGVSEQSTFEAELETVVTINPLASSGSGFASLLTSPLTSTAVTPAGAIVINRGRRRAWPELRVYGPCSGITLRNATTGLTLSLNYDVAAGDVLVIRTAPRERTIRLNGTANRYSALDWDNSVWWALMPGANDIRIGLATFSAGAHVEVSYRDAWG